MFLLYFATMKNVRKFELVCGRLSRMDRCVCQAITFSDLCNEYGADLKIMDNMFYDLLGMSGEEVLEQYRSGSRSFLE